MNGKKIVNKSHKSASLHITHVPQENIGDAGKTPTDKTGKTSLRNITNISQNIF